MSLFDYIDWRGDISFEQVPPNEVDMLILSLISYVDFGTIVSEPGWDQQITLLEAARAYVRAHRGQPTYVGLIVPPEVVSIMAKAAKSIRFGGIRLQGYVNRVRDEDQIQFCAMTFSVSERLHCVIYRGTDDTIIGWKENFNMSFLHPVPAQTEAVTYLETMADLLEGDFILGGHSKGGNLAVFAAVSCDPKWKDRIRHVYNHDGPGFTTEFLSTPEYESMRGRLVTIVPQSSVVGMLLEHEENYEVVKSNQNGLLQHNGFSWEVLGNRFVHLDTITNESRRIDRTVKKWLAEMTAEEREAFVESLYETISSSGAKTLTELNADKIKLVRAWNQLPAQSRALVRKCIMLLITDGARGGIKLPKEP